MSFTKFLPEDNNLLEEEKKYVQLGNKMPEGEYKFRIVSKIINGWKDWDSKDKPHRFRVKNKPKSPIVPGKTIKAFWAMVVWDYQKEDLQILEITQNVLRRSLEMLFINEDWGDPTSFDFKIKKEGTGINTNYKVIPIPPKPMNKAIKDAVEGTKIRLEALYECGDPWADTEEPFKALERDYEHATA